MFKKILREFFFLILIYTIGMLCGVLLLVLRITGRITLIGTDYLRKQGKGLLVVSNHPSYLEAIFLPFIFFPKFLLRPFRDVPWSTPDYQNILAPHGLFWLRYMHMIPIYRGSLADAQKNAHSHRQMLSVLERKGTVILFPEGGRTSSSGKRVTSHNGKELRILQPIAERIQRMTGCTIIPVWVDGTDIVLRRKEKTPRFFRSRIVVRIGPPIEKVISTEVLQNTLLELADGK